MEGVTECHDLSQPVTLRHSCDAWNDASQIFDRLDMPRYLRSGK